MTASAASPVEVESALAAFLRDIERRGLVFAEAQCADGALAHTAIIASKAAFHERAANLTSAQWPSMFWQLLLAQPALRGTVVADARDALSQLGAGQRAALLLRLVAELDPTLAAEALRVSQPAYRHALSRALETLRARGTDAAAVRVLGDRLLQQVMQGPIHLAATHGPDPTKRDPVRQDPMRHDAQGPRAERRIRAALGAVVALMAAALVATFFWQPAFLKSHAVLTNGFEALHAQAPAETLSTTATVLSNPDFDLLDDPQGAHIARDLDLYAWYAAGANAAATNPNAPKALPESSTPETSAPDADAQGTASSAEDSSGAP